MPSTVFSKETAAYLANFVVSADEYEFLLRLLAKPERAAEERHPSQLQKPSKLRPVAVAKSRLGNLLSADEIRLQATELNEFSLLVWRTSSRLYSATYLLAFAGRYIAYLRAKGTLPRPRLLDRTRIKASLSLALLLSLYRLIYRVTSSLHAGVFSSQARKFRRKHRQITKILRSQFFPAFTSAATAGLAYGLLPKGPLRSYGAFYTATLAAEYGFNYVTAQKQFAWLGQQANSWILFPFSIAQLLYAYHYDRDCVSKPFQLFMSKTVENYIPAKPLAYPETLPWPSPEVVVNSLSQVTLDKYPPFNSPILYPDSYVLPKAYSSIDPIVSQAHPGIKNLSCALMHPMEQSCSASYVKSLSRQYLQFARYILPFFTAKTLLSVRHADMNLTKLKLMEMARSATKLNLFLTMVSSTIWSGLCSSQFLISNNVLPTSRMKVIGFVAGLWAYIYNSGGKQQYISVARMATESYWKSLVKHNKVRTIPNGDVLVFAGSFAVIMSLYDRSSGSVESGLIKKVLQLVSGIPPLEPVPASTPSTPNVEKKSPRDAVHL
ncbi:hypothetical protein BZA70DRAFT_290742 [Myxozyma melibiosi]|uniref:Transmembrane protein 135 N-terminal domain-containing protein n=1 Tax=Myxozyma melibiosi TaxID=54550 RepID=A0ABR1F2W5_9ASCO